MRGFYEEHKFLFTILLALKIDLRERKIKQEEFEVFIKGNVTVLFSISFLFDQILYFFLSLCIW